MQKIKQNDDKGVIYGETLQTFPLKLPEKQICSKAVQDSTNESVMC